jgi:hypothetical protein
MSMRRHGTAGVVLALIVVWMAGSGFGCGEGHEDAGVEQRAGGKRPVVNMPDEFANLAGVCFYGHLVIETTQNHNSKALAIIPNDPSCRGRHGQPPVWAPR